MEEPFERFFDDVFPSYVDSMMQSNYYLSDIELVAMCRCVGTNLAIFQHFMDTGKLMYINGCFVNAEAPLHLPSIQVNPNCDEVRSHYERLSIAEADDAMSSGTAQGPIIVDGALMAGSGLSIIQSFMDLSVPGHEDDQQMEQRTDGQSAQGSGLRTGIQGLIDEALRWNHEVNEEADYAMSSSTAQGQSAQESDLRFGMQSFIDYMMGSNNELNAEADDAKSSSSSERAAEDSDEEDVFNICLLYTSDAADE